MLRQMLGPGTSFREGQWPAIKAIAYQRRRVLVVQRTGWGKSLVYFLATRLLRDQKVGPTLLISPLLSLMRNQIAMAERIGIRAVTINSTNEEQWATIEGVLAEDACDILLISPERLNNDRFLKTVLPLLGGRIGLFAVDEAHCISDWGHDFRPDYRRIVRVLQALPAKVPVLATTATANNRVVADVEAQLGSGLLIQRGPLARTSLRLQNIRLLDQSERLAWLSECLPEIPGSGIVYCLTVADTERVARWLQSRGITALSYHADLSAEERNSREDDLLANRVKALVATVALGMGFDKPDLGFVIHYQRPGSVIAYYQQVGRAGRAVDEASGILLSGREDDEIQAYFIRTAFPPADLMVKVLEQLEGAEGLTIRQLQTLINVSHGALERALKLMEIDGAVARERHTYFRTPNPWNADIERAQQVTERRRAELKEMQEYLAHAGCLMEFLAHALDDPAAEPCGRCANCSGEGLPSSMEPQVVNDAVTFLKGAILEVPPRRQWPLGAFQNHKGSIPEDKRSQVGRVLSLYGDAGWG
ncbi:MAG: RecQ family ATP-dependent DNA helicase, partial [Chloroflexi bacterium]|nr:RecQ family ATP-dependent DNA helicase [Chloroflexota bacterium]